MGKALRPEDLPREAYPPRPKSALQLATEAVYGDRNKDYGEPIDNHTRTARLWSEYLGVEITARQVCMMNVLQKVSRDAHLAGHDNLVDIAGYAENAHLCEHPRKPRTEGR